MLRLPSEADVPDGAHGRFVLEMGAIYRAGGRPPLRDIEDAVRERDDLRGHMSRERLRKMLLGLGLPRPWEDVEAVLQVLAQRAGLDVARPHGQQADRSYRQYLLDLWNEALDEPPVPVPVPAAGGLPGEPQLATLHAEVWSTPTEPPRPSEAGSPPRWSSNSRFVPLPSASLNSQESYPTIHLLGEVSVARTPPQRSIVLRSLLAQLALDPGRPVATTTLIDELYGEALPRNPTAALQVQVTRLRKWVAPFSVTATGHGYALDADRDKVDLCRFLDADDAMSAMLMMTGEPFPGCRSSPRLDAERRRVERRWLELVEARADGLLAAGEPSLALATAAPVLANHRNREHLAVTVATALHQVGRTGEAMSTLADTRNVLNTEAWTGPSAELNAAEAYIRSHVTYSAITAPSRP